MRSPSRMFAAALLLLSGCSLVPAIGPSPQLFSGANVAKVDFESDALSQPPEGFDARAGQWAVVDSPTATSGNQVLVRGGETAATLALKSAEAVHAAGGEVSVRVFIGPAGAGLACGGRDGGAGYTLKFEPDTKRVALYRTGGAGDALVAQTPVAGSKGVWTRIGLRCEPHRVTGYVDGKAKLHDGGVLDSFDLALCADPGVIAQFDDLAYWARK